MSDTLTVEQRSEVMRRNRSTNTKPELTVRKALHRMGVRFRLHRRDLPGVPDIVLPGRKAVIFVHGCFWHGHQQCRRASVPKTRTEYWTRKISGNVARDTKHAEELRALGWTVITLWECEIKGGKALEDRLLCALPPRIITGPPRNSMDPDALLGRGDCPPTNRHSLKTILKVGRNLN